MLHIPATVAVSSIASASEDERVSSTLSQIAAAVAGLALLTTGFVVFPESHTKGLAKGLTISVSLAILAAVLITFARDLGSWAGR
ncbi:hypothetical protein [Bradyrhizobium manausense]|uniref:hypothetical protein n=1 Tax=Bradyrhizobium manausense TaxID=989370 RepID=UPI001BAB3E68|nr:hypothetical protein [Bradyrhizobium manausense]MBR0724629.1 hypothetical protein [Bradyrhizobium manausense]